MADEAGVKVTPVESDGGSDPFADKYDPRKRMSYDKSKALEAQQNHRVKYKVRIFCEDPHSSTTAVWFHLVYGLVIMASVMAFCTETLNFKGKPIGKNLKVEHYKILEIVFTAIFILDIVVRAAVAERVCCSRCCRSKSEDDDFGAGAPTPFFLDIMVIFDVLSVLPLPVAEIIKVTNLDQVAPWLQSSVRVLSICRILRIFKVTRNFDGAKVLFLTAKTSIKPLTVSFIVLISVMVIVSAILFFVEPCYSNDCIFTDQMNAAYYLVITLTTIGYGDQIPTSIPGRTIGVLIAFLGSFYMAMPLAIIGSKFEDAFKERELAAVQKSRTRAHDLKEQLSHVSNKERRARVLRLALKLFEILQTAIDASETESRFFMKTFPKKADILCNDISSLFEISMNGNSPKLSMLKRSDSVRALEQIKMKKRRRNTQSAIKHNLMHSVNEIHKAKQSNACRDRVWLCMNETGPTQSKCSKRFRMTQLVIVALSIGTVGLETLPELNSYGSDSRLCKQVVNHFCTNYVKDDDDAILHNPGCFPLTIEIKGKNVSYGGCRVKDGKFEDCGFPSPGAGITCEHEQIITKSERVEYIDLADTPNGTRVITTEMKIEGIKYLQKTNDGTLSNEVKQGIKLFNAEGTKLLRTVQYWETLQAFDKNWKGLTVDPESQEPPLIDMCSRTQCINNNVQTSRDFPALFFYVEVFFILCFTVEIFVRLLVMRSCKRFFMNFANIIDLTAAGVALGEIVWIPLGWGSAKYEVWGMGTLADPAIFRVTRVLVAVRFISLQKQSGGLEVIGTTLYRTWRKLVIPSVFFFLFVLIFAGIYYTVESGSLYACSPQRLAEIENSGFVHRDSIEPLDANGNFVPNNCKVCVEKDAYDGSPQFHVNNYDGACTLLVMKGDETMGHAAIQDMFDAMWTMIITMTTVGYGGKYPYTSSGKLVAIASAILGSLYMAMPLTIVGNKFYYIYEQVEAQRTKAEYKTAQLSFESSKAKKVVPLRDEAMSSEEKRQVMDQFKLGHVVNLKRWVYRTKKKLAVSHLNEDEKVLIVEYLKFCRKICGLSRYNRTELQEFSQHHKNLIVVLSKHLIHKHVEGIDTLEATLY